MNMPPVDLLVFNVSREEVENKFYKPVKDYIKTLETLGLKAYQKGAISFDGYDDDMREIPEIPEIRAFIRKLLNDHPHLFFYMSFKMEVPSYMAPCLGDYYSVYKGKKLTKEEITEMYKNNQELPQIRYHIHIPETNVRRMQRETVKHAARFNAEPLAELIVDWLEPFKQPLNHR